MIKNIFLNFICYFSFGIICLLGNIIFVPVILLGLNKNLKVQFFCRDLVRIFWGIFLKICCISGKIKIEFKEKNINFCSCLIIANHPSLLDVVFMLANLPRINCVVKASLKKNIFLFGAIKASGYISNEDEERLLGYCLDALRKGENLLIFPEGTRTKESIVFHKAAFYIAINAAKKLRAYKIDMDKTALKQNHIWYKTPNINYIFSLEKDIDITEFYNDLPNPLRVRKLHSQIEKFYQKELKNE